MAGQIIISNIKTDSDNAFSILANTGAVLFSANLASGITTGIADGSVTNAKLAGSITGDKITVGSLAGNVFTANTITGDKIGQSAISSNNIVSVNASVASVGTLPTARLPAGSVLQVVQSAKTDTFSESVAAGAISGDATGLTPSITPATTSNKVLVRGCVFCHVTSNELMLVLYRNGSAIFVGDTAGNRSRVTGGIDCSNSDEYWGGISFEYLDSPSSTSAVTYSVRFRHSSGTTRTVYVNRATTDNDVAGTGRAASSITLMEIAA